MFSLLDYVDKINFQERQSVLQEVVQGFRQLLASRFVEGVVECGFR